MPRAPSKRCSAALGTGHPVAGDHTRHGGRCAGFALLASATAMADVQPLRALHYDPSVAGPLSDLVAPPYDVIDAGQRSELIARSPFNVVNIDLPQGEPNPYSAAGELF